MLESIGARQLIALVKQMLLLKLVLRKVLCFGDVWSDVDVDLLLDVRRPTVLADNKDQTGSIGSTVKLHCRVNDARGQPEVNWFREHKQLPTQSRVNGEYLQIYNLQPEDSGRYFCEISTPEGRASDYINLNVDASK